jgi:AcrR family transcriptional regulator
MDRPPPAAPRISPHRTYLHEVPVAQVLARRRWVRDDWIVFALDALEQEGVGALRIEVLARRAGRTPGSFYAHFKSRDELLEAVIEAWNEYKLAASMTLDSRLLREGRFTLAGIFGHFREKGGREPTRPDLEIAMREWARHDERAHAAVLRNDMQRLNNTTAMVIAEFPDAPHPQVFALMFLWLLRGRSITFVDPQQKALTDTLDLTAEAFVRMYRATANGFKVPRAPRWTGKFKPWPESSATPAAASRKRRRRRT